jgi:hypothetical protein
MRRTRALLLLAFAALAFGDSRDARAQHAPLVVAQAFGVKQTPDPAMRALLESLPRAQRRAVIREMRSQPTAERAAWRERFLAQPPSAQQQQIDAWVAKHGTARTEPRPSSFADGAALRERLASMHSEELLELRDTVAQLQQLSAPERSALSDRLARIAAANADERARFDAKLARWEALSSAERDRLRARWRRFQALPIAEREQILKAHDTGSAAAP